MMRKLRRFLRDEDGAVTVDWVVLTAALVGLGLAVMAVVRTGAQTQTANIESVLMSDSVIKTSFSGLGTLTKLTGSALSDLQNDAASLDNADLQAAYTTEQGSVNGSFASWQSGIADNTYSLSGTDYVDSGNNVAFTQADYDASLVASERASVYRDEAQQRGQTLN
jgi:Flp pilus assembly pilin Flp